MLNKTYRLGVLPSWKNRVLNVVKSCHSLVYFSVLFLTIITGNKGGDGHFARTDLTGECAGGLLPLKAASALLSSVQFTFVNSFQVFLSLHAWFWHFIIIQIFVFDAQYRNMYIQLALSICTFIIYEMCVYMFVCGLTQQWKKRIRWPAVCTSPARITTKTTASTESVSSPASWPNPPAGIHQNTHTHIYTNSMIMTCRDRANRKRYWHCVWCFSLPSCVPFCLLCKGDKKWGSRGGLNDNASTVFDLRLCHRDAHMWLQLNYSLQLRVLIACSIFNSVTLAVG